MHTSCAHTKHFVSAGVTQGTPGAKSISPPHRFDTGAVTTRRNVRVAADRNNQSTNVREVRVPLGEPPKRPEPSSTQYGRSAAQVVENPTTQVPSRLQVENDAKRARLAEIVRTEEHAQFMCPYDSDMSPEQRAKLPFLLYLPGLDGTGLAASKQFPSMVQAFDLAALSVPLKNRLTFAQLVQLIIQYLEKKVAESPIDRPIYVLGESMGGIFALAVAAERADLVDRVVVVNPATSFPQSIWPVVGPIMFGLNQVQYRRLPLLLTFALGNPFRFALSKVDRSQSLLTQLEQFSEGVRITLPRIAELADIIPQETLKWKFKLMEDGSKFVNERLRKIQQRVLVLASDQDWLIPSREEGRRLKQNLPRCRLMKMEGKSHGLLQEAGVDFVDLLKEVGFYTEKRRLSTSAKKRSKTTFGSPAAIELPTPKELELDSRESMGQLNQLTSPVFFSTTVEGQVVQGLSGLPSGRPLLFVGNHQLYALDTGGMVVALAKEAGILLRGLAHPTVFGERVGLEAVDPRRQSQSQSPISSVLATYGAVRVGARNFYKLMQNKEAVLLYPGGAREAFRGKGKKYQLFWPERAEFIRMAAKFGATVIPFAGIGSEDALTMLLDANELQQLPVIGDRIRQSAGRQGIPQARRGVSAIETEENMIMPLSVPTAVPRFYYRFMRPIQLSPEDLKNDRRCQQRYQEVKSEVESGIEYLLRQRNRDPYKDFLPRALYEATWRGSQAPTFLP